MYSRQQKELDRLQAKVAKGDMSRREFLSRVSAMGLGAMAPGLYMQGAMAAPKKGGTLRQALTGGASSDSLDPATFMDSYMINVGMGQLRNNLTEIDENNQLVPELAESWESSDAKTWVFNLRQGVTFHNGKPMTSADVIYSINLHRGEDSTSGAKGLLGNIIDISADGPNTMVVSLSSGNADLPFLIGDFHLLIVPDGTTDFSKGVFTGPYILQEFVPGERLVAKRNPNYWKADRAHADEVEILIIDDTTSRISALMSGEVHIAGRVDPQSAGLINSTPGVHVENHPAAGHRPLLMQADKLPFGRVSLRSWPRHFSPRFGQVQWGGRGGCRGLG